MNIGEDDKSDDGDPVGHALVQKSTIWWFGDGGDDENEDD